MPFARTQAMPLVRSTRSSAGALWPWLPRPRHPSSPRRRLGDGGSPADAEEHAHVRGVTLARADSTPVMTDLSGTRMDPLDRAPLRQRIVSIVLSAPSQGSSCSAPPPVLLIAWQGWRGIAGRVSSPLRGRGDNKSGECTEGTQGGERARLRAQSGAQRVQLSEQRRIEHERAERALAAAGSQRERSSRVPMRCRVDREAREAPRSTQARPWRAHWLPS